MPPSRPPSLPKGPCHDHHPCAHLPGRRRPPAGPGRRPSRRPGGRPHTDPPVDARPPVVPGAGRGNRARGPEHRRAVPGPGLGGGTGHDLVGRPRKGAPGTVRRAGGHHRLQGRGGHPAVHPRPGPAVLAGPGPRGARPAGPGPRRADRALRPGRSPAPSGPCGIRGGVRHPPGRRFRTAGGRRARCLPQAGGRGRGAPPAVPAGRPRRRCRPSDRRLPPDRAPPPGHPPRDGARGRRPGRCGGAAPPARAAGRARAAPAPAALPRDLRGAGPAAS